MALAHHVEGKRRQPDVLWMALEERVTAHVAKLQWRQDADRSDTERVFHASLTRLETRVRGLENQGVRSDRRAAELAGLAQALTEEQRALLVRLDRLEERVKGSSRQREASHPMGEECIRWLGRLQREQRDLGVNLRTVFQCAEETQQLQHARLRHLSETVDGRLRPVEVFLNLREREGGSSTPPRCPHQAWKDDVPPLVEDLDAAERRASKSLEAARELLRRCEAHSGNLCSRHCAAIAGLGQDVADEVNFEGGTAHSEPCDTNTEAIGELQKQFGELSRNLVPRTDVVEAQVAALIEAFEDFQWQSEHRHVPKSRQDGASEPGSRTELVDGKAPCSNLEHWAEAKEYIDAKLLARLEGLPTREQVAEAACGADVAGRMDVAEDALSKVIAQVEALPTREQVSAVYRDVQSAQAEALRSQLETFARTHANKIASNSEACTAIWRRLEELKNQLDGLPAAELISRLCTEAVTVQFSELQTYLERTSNIAHTVDAHVDAIAQVRRQVDSLPTHEQVAGACWEVHASKAEFQDVLEQGLRAQERHAGLLAEKTDAHAEALTSLRETVDALIEINARSRQHQADLAEVRILPAEVGQLSRKVMENSESIVELRECMQACVAQPRGGEFEAMQRQVEQLASTAQVDCVARQVAQQAGVVEELREITQQAHSEMETRFQAFFKELSEEPAGCEEMSEDDGWKDVVVGSWEDTVRSLHDQLHSLQDVVDGRVLSAVWQVERQLPAASEKVDQVTRDCAERIEKLEEHEVKLGIAHAKIATQEQRLQICLDRVERLPTTTQVRSLWREELQKQFDEANIEELSRKVEVQAHAIDELGDRIQFISRRLPGERRQPGP